ncbi:MAG: SMI1/KNR4 family protein [Burkholderiales bacterium]|nr:SMI1/KNR4 family protein [Burkholderiales bacterium]
MKEVEALLGVKLPQSYVDLMRRQNGGYVEERLISPLAEVPQEMKYYIGDGYVSVGSIAGLNPRPGAHGSITQTTYMVDEWDLPKGVVLLDGDGHTWIALDYRQAKENPPVIFLISDSGRHINIAKDFSDFLDRMIPSEKMYDEKGNLRSTS